MKSKANVSVKSGASLLLWISIIFSVATANAAQSWTQHAGYRSTPVAVEAGTHTAGFALVPMRLSGVAFSNVISLSRYLTNQIPLNGSGVAAGDIDGDEHIDLVFGGLGGGTRLYRNLGDWRFSDITASSGVDMKMFDVSGVALADLDGDGDPDLLANTIGQGTPVWLNDGRGHFQRAALFNPDRAGMSLALADAEGDGDLDVYIANYRSATVRDDPIARFRISTEGGRQEIAAYNGRPATSPELIGRFHITPGGAIKENGEPDRLYLNDGQGRFSEVSWSTGVFLDEDGQALLSAPFDWGLSVLFRDFTGDGLPDLYVCNDFESPDRFWINETKRGGPLRFRAASTLALRTTSAFSMGVDVADVNRDGHWDFFVADMLSRDHRLRNLQVSGLPPSRSQIGVYQDRTQFSQNTLQLGRGDGTFGEAARLSGVQASEWSWTPLFLDVDLDGFEDLLISNGHEMEMMDADVADQAEQMKTRKRLTGSEQLDLRKLFRRLDSPNAAFRNRGDGTFTDTSRAWGFDEHSVAHGMCLADLDADGDLDVVINNLNGPATILRNIGNAPRILVMLKGQPPNTRGIGARVRVRGGPVEQQQEIIAGGRYLSSDAPQRSFACGSATQLAIEVTWRSGRTTAIQGVRPNRIYEISESSEGTPGPAAPQSRTIPWFADLSAKLNHRHHQDPFDDFARQRLMPRNLSTSGPGVTWADLNGDGKDDLLIGAGPGGMLAVFENDGTGGFRILDQPPLNRALPRGMTTVLTQGSLILAGASNYADGLTNGGCLRVLDLNRKASGDALIGQASSAGPVAQADVDRDGSLELFVGGRAIPARYPEAATSLLVKTINGRLRIQHRFEQLGLVTGAVFTDLNGDGNPELVIACEWGPIRIFEHQGEDWKETTSSWGLAPFTGWWNSVAAGDFDGDGRMDLIAGNWGWNANLAWRADAHSQTVPSGTLVACYYGAPVELGEGGLLETYFGVDRREWPVRKRNALVAAIPALQERFATRDAFGRATAAELFPKVVGHAQRVEASWMASTCFLNRGGKFEARPLPIEAQLAPVYGIAVADFDGDGHEDVFLAQNFFGTNPDEARLDAGRGVLLHGDGAGHWTSIDGAQSGLLVYGEGRGAAVADYDGDGRVDLAVGQNGAETRLFRNQSARPGLRIRVKGPSPNPTGVGTVLRVRTEGKLGPAREIHSGAGYWSCDSPVTVMSVPQTASHLWIRWPDGTEKEYALPVKTGEVTVDPVGGIQP